MRAIYPEIVLWLALITTGCDRTDKAETDAPEGMDPSLALASRGGATYPATSTTASLGRGFDSLQGEVLGDCVIDSGTVSFSGSEFSAGASSDLVFNYARSREELANALGVSAEVSATFPFISASARGEWAQGQETTSDTTFLVLSYVIVNDTQTLKSFELSPGAERVLSERGPTEFYEMCGDQFVAARVTGGSLHVVLEITDNTSSLSREAAAGADVGAWIFSVGGEVREEAREELQSKKVRFKVFQDGGLKGPSDLLSVLTFAFGFRDEVTGANAKFAKPIAFITKPYSIVPTRSSVPIPALTQQRRKLNELAGWHVDAKLRRNDLVQAEAAGGQCPNKQQRFEAAIQDVEGYVKAIENEAEQCLDNPLRGCGGGKARPLPKRAHQDVIDTCASELARREEILAKKRVDAERQDLQAQLREERKGEEDGAPCKTWELRYVKPTFGNAAEWVSVSASASAGGSLRATDTRTMVEGNGWVVTPEMQVPANADVVIEGKQHFETGCGWFDGPCRRGDKTVSAWKLRLGPTVSNGATRANGFDVRVQCVESANGPRRARRVPADSRRPMPRPMPGVRRPQRQVPP